MFNGGVTVFGPISLTQRGLLAAAGERSYRRGLEYLSRVEGLRVRGRHLTATVRGSDEYQVVLTVEPDGAVRGECSCPFSREGHFCKHCVAAGLAALAAGPALAEPAPGTPPAPATGSLLAWLDSLSRDDLYVLLAEQLTDDQHWRWRLELRAAAQAGDVATVHRRADQLLDPVAAAAADASGEIAPAAYARTVRAVTAALAALTGAGHGADAVQLAEHAIGQASLAARLTRDDSGLIEAAAAQLAARHGAARF